MPTTKLFKVIVDTPVPEVVWTLSSTIVGAVYKLGYLWSTENPLSTRLIESDRDVNIDLVVVSWSDNEMESDSDLESDLVVYNWSNNGTESDRLTWICFFGS